MDFNDKRRYNKGNPKIKEISKKATGPKTEMGKFVVAVNHLKNIDLTPENYKGKIPTELLSLYEWVRGLKKNDIDYLLELQNMYDVLKDNVADKILERVLNKEELTKRDIDTLILIKGILVDSHKLKFGDKTTIEHAINVEDLRTQMFSNRKIIDADVLIEKPDLIEEAKPDDN